MALSGVDRVLLPKHTRREFRERMQSEELQACIIPVAATEQHLEHLSMEHDWRSVNHIAEGVASKLSPNVLIAPSMNIGISEHYMRHPGTLSAMPGSWLGVLFDTIRSMNHAGFTNILVLNGHGGNIAPCEGMWGQFLQRLEIHLQVPDVHHQGPSETVPGPQHSSPRHSQTSVHLALSMTCCAKQGTMSSASMEETH